jgi:hypothetical protein
MDNFNDFSPHQGQNSPDPGRSGAKIIPNTAAGKNKVTILF